jgi:5-formyltetrahydrofolate cyclo-ligase
LAESLKRHGRPHFIALDREQALVTAQAGGTISSSTDKSPDVRLSAAALRQQMRDARNRIPQRTQFRAAKNLSRQAKRLKCFSRSRMIACYLPSDGEIDTRPLILSALDDGKRMALPVVDRNIHGRMRFAEWSPGMPLMRNDYGIREPLRADRRYVAPGTLEMVLLPLVAFDPLGNRLGMGGGYYDRCFSFLAGRPNRRPVLVGVAYEIQKVKQLDTQAWDIPLSWVITEAGIYRCLF